MTLINDSKSFTFFEFLDYDLLEKERTEIRHLIFEKKGLIIVPRDRNNAQDSIRRLSFHNDKNRKQKLS